MVRSEREIAVKLKILTDCRLMMLKHIPEGSEPIKKIEFFIAALSWCFGHDNAFSRNFEFAVSKTASMMEKAQARQGAGDNP